MDDDMSSVDFYNGRKVLIDKDRNVACEELGVFTIHVSDNYYLGIGSHVLNFLRFDEEGPRYFVEHGKNKYWASAGEYVWERLVFKSLCNVEYSYVDSVRNYIRGYYPMGLPNGAGVCVPVELRDEFNRFYIQFKYGK